MAKKKTVTTKAQLSFLRHSMEELVVKQDETTRRTNLSCAAVDALINKVTTLEDTLESVMLDQTSHAEKIEGIFDRLDEMFRCHRHGRAQRKNLGGTLHTLEQRQEAIMLAGEQLEKQRDKQANQIDQLVSDMRRHRKTHRINADFRKRRCEKFESTITEEVRLIGDEQDKQAERNEQRERIDALEREQESAAHVRGVLHEQISCGLHGHGPIELMGIRRRVIQNPVFLFRCLNCNAQYEVEGRGKLSRAERRIVRALSKKPGTTHTGIK